MLIRDRGMAPFGIAETCSVFFAPLEVPAAIDFVHSPLFYTWISSISNV
jgi:hypothetical protein